MESTIYLLSDHREDLLKEIIYATNSLGFNNNLTRGIIKNETFSDNEMNTSFIDSVKGKRVYLLSSFDSSDEIIRLNIAIDAAKRARASEIIPILPYYIYGRGDKRDNLRGPISGKLIASMLENSGATSIIGFDFHADQIQGFFDIPVDHIEGKSVFVDYIANIYNPDIICCSPDQGGSKRVERVVTQVHTDYGIDIRYVTISKTRPAANIVGEMTVIGDVVGKDVIILDDILDTAGTLCKAAETLMNDGAKSVTAIITHGVLSGPAIERINNSQLKEVIISNSLKKQSDFIGVSEKIKVISVAPQIALVIASINNSLSYEELKEKYKKGRYINEK